MVSQLLGKGESSAGVQPGHDDLRWPGLKRRARNWNKDMIWTENSRTENSRRMRERVFKKMVRSDSGKAVGKKVIIQSSEMQPRCCAPKAPNV